MTSPSPARRTQEDRRSESEQRLLRAARRLIARNGAAGTTLAEIGLEAGYSRGLPSERFGSKQALLERLVDSVEQAFQAQVALDVGDRTGLAAVEARIRAHFNGALQGATGVRALYLLYMESLTVAPALRARIAALSRAYRDAFARHLREAQAAGEIRRDVDPAQQALVILGAIRGLINQWLIEPRGVDLAAARTTLVATVRRALT
ncbi:MAG: TetR/AcrR family transcriptional regulator [Reyranellaceae bacterium]